MTERAIDRARKLRERLIEPIVERVVEAFQHDPDSGSLPYLVAMEVADLTLTARDEAKLELLAKPGHFTAAREVEALGITFGKSDPLALAILYRKALHSARVATAPVDGWSAPTDFEAWPF